jgi:hypothetical protein
MSQNSQQERGTLGDGLNDGDEPTETDTQRQLRYNVESVRDELIAADRLADFYQGHAGDSAEDVAETLAEDFAGPLEEHTDEMRASLRVLLEDLDTLCDLDPTIDAAVKTVMLAAEELRNADDRDADEDESEGSAAAALVAMIEPAWRRLEEHSGPASLWLDDQLEIYADGRYSLAAPGWSIETWGVLTTFGGPTVRVTFRGDDFDVDGYWGTDHERAWGSCAAVGNYLEGLEEAYNITKEEDR